MIRNVSVNFAVGLAIAPVTAIVFWIKTTICKHRNPVRPTIKSRRGNSITKAVIKSSQKIKHRMVDMAVKAVRSGVGFFSINAVELHCSSHMSKTASNTYATETMRARANMHACPCMRVEQSDSFGISGLALKRN
eukprot:CAMPEP_0172677048 /NCGR_PEP_ID=MMETSP1074-20121228/14411_1 /TAXON_ID=2916 /ORGANISM="Ceratium fusus, Strain PA161109" /LENGTH=134 /DNA_ID=CAMNT_0013494825 /DNA_START=39 /DNA_END=443 /DNA_ORIENTATION=-